MASFREQAPTERFEKRKLFRFPVQLPAQLGKGDDLSSICTNLSTNGASVETSMLLMVGERLSVTVTISPDEEPLRMVGQVMWKRDIHVMDVEAHPVMEVGIRFLRPLPSLEKPMDEEYPELDPMSAEEEGYVFPR